MGTPIRSRNDPPPQDTSDSQDPPPNPNPNPSDGVIDDPPVTDPPADTEEARLKRYSAILEDTLREQNRTIQQLQNATPPVAPPAAPPRNPEAERQDFYNDPIEATRKVVKTALEETVAPLLDFVKEMRGATTTDRIKNQVKNDPRFSGIWDADIERAVDETLTRVAPDKINEDVVRSAAVQAIGLKTMNMLPTTTPRTDNPNPNPNPPAPTERRVTTPPHMRPSAPPAPSSQTNGAKKLRPLTENEERLRRENKQTHEDFLFWLELPANEVTTAIPPSQRGKK